MRGKSRKTNKNSSICNILKKKFILALRTVYTFPLFETKKFLIEVKIYKTIKILEKTCSLHLTRFFFHLFSFWMTLRNMYMCVGSNPNHEHRLYMLQKFNECVSILSVVPSDFFQFRLSKLGWHSGMFVQVSLLVSDMFTQLTLMRINIHSQVTSLYYRGRVV